jgi:cytochrome P450
MSSTVPRTFPSGDLPRLDFDPVLGRLLQDGRPCQVQLPYGEAAWLVTRYADVKTVLADPRFSRASAADRDEPRMRVYRGTPGTIISLDPPEHSRLRQLVAKAFTGRRVAQLRPRTEQTAGSLLDQMLAHGAPADLVGGFALPLPIAVICELLGIPYEDRADFRVWTEAIVSVDRHTPEQVASCLARLREYMAGLIAERRTAAKGDLLSALIAARDEENRLSEHELVTLAEAILVAGHETTATQIPNFLHVLLTHPRQLAMLRADIDLVPQAVEELLRFVPLVRGTAHARYALEDVELGGVIVRAGEPVVVSLPAANRDEAIYTTPGLLDLRRNEASHLAFGHGPHHCLGAALARMELEVALRTLLTRLPGLRFAGSARDIIWKAGVTVRGPDRMLVAWDQL